jgi:structural maintenance of chromosomes protein 5
LQIAVNTLLRLHNELFEAELLAIEAESELTIVRERNSEVSKLLGERKNEIKQLDHDVRAQKVICEKLLKEFQDAQTALSEEEQANMTEWCEPIGNLDELNAEIESINGRIELLHEGNPGLMQQYEKRQREIEKLEDRVNNFDTELTRLNESISRIRGQWEPELEKLVSEISDAFSYNFGQIGCAGQVNITKDDEDFSQWAIRIEVKFR